MFLDITLIITSGYDKVNLNLHFSSFSNEYSLFKTGLQLNLYKKFTESDNKLIVKDSFSALIEFDYYGLEDGMEVYKNDDFQYVITKDDSYYTLKDIDGSAITYNVSNSSLESIKHKSRYLIRSGITTSFYVFGNYSLLISISEGSTLFDTIQLMNGNTVVKEVRINYLNDYIYNSNELLKTIINNFGLSQSFVYDNNKNIIQKSKIMSNTYADENERSVICDYFASMNSILWKKERI